MKPRHFGVSSEVRPLETERIVRVLASRDVEYVLIGGLAALAHGSTIATADVDVLPQLEIANLERLLDALEELDAAILIGERRQQVEAGEPWEQSELNTRGAEALLAADAWHFTTGSGPVDVVVRVTDVGPYDAHIRSAERRDVFGVRINIAGLDELIASKEATKRPKDEAILRELRELEGRESP